MTLTTSVVLSTRMDIVELLQEVGLSQYMEAAQHSVGLRLPTALGRDLANVVADMRRRCRVLGIDGGDALSGDEVVVLVDDRELLVGTMTDPAQAVVSRNRALWHGAPEPIPSCPSCTSRSGSSLGSHSRMSAVIAQWSSGSSILLAWLNCTRRLLRAYARAVSSCPPSWLWTVTSVSPARLARSASSGSE